MADVRARALSALREGRVTVTLARGPAMGPPTEVCALVDSSRGNSQRYVVDLLAGAVWSCTCGLSTGCVHVAAVQLVTGHKSAAARPAKASAA